MWARRCVRLLEAVGTAQPCLVSVMVTAIHQYLDDADQFNPDGLHGAALASVGMGLTPQQWRGELDRLVVDMGRGEPADVVLRHRLLLERMHALMPNGMAYPPHTEAHVISPEMHNVVRAAAMTVTEDDLFTLDSDTDLPTPAGVLLLPQVCGSGSARYAPVSVIGWRPQTGRVLPGWQCGGDRGVGGRDAAWPPRREPACQGSPKGRPSTGPMSVAVAVRGAQRIPGGGTAAWHEWTATVPEETRRWAG